MKSWKSTTRQMKGTWEHNTSKNYNIHNKNNKRIFFKENVLPKPTTHENAIRYKKKMKKKRKIREGEALNKWEK